MSVEFLKQVEISDKQPYFQPNFSEQNDSPKQFTKKTSVAMNLLQYPNLIYFFNEVMRFVVRENHWLLRFFC
jgi:hypothetical protein